MIGTEQTLGRRWLGPSLGLLALTAGLICTLSVPPFGFWIAGILGIAVLSIVMDLHQRNLGPIRWSARFRYGFSFAFGLYIVSLWWMSQFSIPGAIFVAFLESLITGLSFVVLPRRSASLAIPAGLVLADSLRSLWPFGGLPLGGIDLGQANGPLARMAAFGGRLLVIGTAATIAVLVGQLAVCVVVRGEERAERTKKLAGLLAAVGTLAATMWWAPTGTHLVGRNVRVAIVQGGGRRGERASEATAARTFEAHLAATESLSRAQGADLILWPENTVDVSKLETSREFARLMTESARLGALMMVGLVEHVSAQVGLNEEATFGSHGEAASSIQRYEKVRRVPFGEYFPFRNIIEKYKLAPIPHHDFRPGHKPGFLDAAGTRFAVSISYEGFFDDRSRGGVRAGGTAVLIPTNAASYVTMQVPTQQLAAARLRAIETGRWVIQAAPTGLSAVIDPDGVQVWRSKIEMRQTHVARIALRSGFTPYVRYNDVPALVVFGAWGVCCYLLRRRPESPAAE